MQFQVNQSAMPPTPKSRPVAQHLRRVERLRRSFRICAGIAADADTHEVGAAEFALMRRFGRPAGSGSKTQITLRIDTAVIDKFMATGPGWQTRINEVLRAIARSLCC